MTELTKPQPEYQNDHINSLQHNYIMKSWFSDYFNLASLASTRW